MCNCNKICAAFKFQIEIQKTACMTYLEENKLEKSYRVTTWDVSKWKKSTIDVLKVKYIMKD